MLPLLLRTTAGLQSHLKTSKLITTSKIPPQTPQLFFIFYSQTYYLLTLIVLADYVKDPYFDPSYIWETKFTAHNLTSHGLLLFSRNTDQTHVGQSSFLLHPKKKLTNLQKYKMHKILSQCVCYWYDLLRWIFCIPCDDWKTSIFYKCLSLMLFFQTPCCCFLWNKCFERTPYFNYLHKKIIDTNVPK